MTLSTSCPALLVAAPASGQGKTTVVSALARLLTRQGHRVRVFKCGPDFLDPFWHQLASGHAVYQIDLWMTGENDAQDRLLKAAQESEFILIEGVMGLFDGEPSAADLAQRFGIPVLAVVDASAMAGTFGALAYGLRNYRPRLPWAGVLANRVASTPHAEMLSGGVESEHWMGALPNSAKMTLPERHLGLTVATELSDALQRLDAAADALAQTPLGQMGPEDWARWNVEFSAPSAAPVVEPWLTGRRVAIARDAAFCFVYQANLETLQQLGAITVFFSPLAGESVPPCDAIWLPGGYPELHAQSLSEQHRLRQSLQAHAACGRPIWAECGGMMALFDEIELINGDVYPMWGLLPGRVTMQTRLAALGPQELPLSNGVLRGHTFHYSTASTSAAIQTRTRRPGMQILQNSGEAVYAHGSVRGSYFHPWFASAPRAAASLFLRESDA